MPRRNLHHPFCSIAVLEDCLALDITAQANANELALVGSEIKPVVTAAVDVRITATDADDQGTMIMAERFCAVDAVSFTEPVGKIPLLEEGSMLQQRCS
ncbi:MAG: hypothetical protein ACUVX8_00685 [Candidatus Zipacnadales bacterium]